MLGPPRTLSILLLALCALAGPVSLAAAQTPVPPNPTTGDVAHDAGLQWGLDIIGAPAAWSTGRGSGVVIAVIDSGVSLDHEDLASQLVPGVACRRTDGDPAACTGSALDDDGHGSHVAGIAAASTGNGPGISGVAPDARIMPIKVLFKSCPTCQASGNAGDVSAGIRWAAERGADVINLSLGSTTSSVFGPEFVDAIRYAWSQGAIPVVAAGNQFVLTADFGDAPAMVVSATDRHDGAPGYSNGVGSAQWAVAAPGGEEGDTPETCAQGGDPVGVLSTYWAPGDDAAYACLSGTSMAAPHVSGSLAVLLSGGATPAGAMEALLATAVDLGPPGWDDVFGSGRIDLAAAAARVAANPLATPTSVVSTTVPSTTAPPVASTVVPSSGVVPPTTGAAVPSPPDSSLEETSAPQPFIASSDDRRVVPAGVAALSILVVTVAALALRRRRMV